MSNKTILILKIIAAIIGLYIIIFHPVFITYTILILVILSILFLKLYYIIKENSNN
jgi:hypothetical protein